MGLYNALVCGSTTIAYVLIDGHFVRSGLFLLVSKTQTWLVLTTVGAAVVCLKICSWSFSKGSCCWFHDSDLWRCVTDSR